MVIQLDEVMPIPPPLSLAVLLRFRCSGGGCPPAWPASAGPTRRTSRTKVAEGSEVSKRG